MQAVYHLPGLFEFHELYRVFLPLYRSHRDWFYDWCTIGSVYGAPAGCRWDGGRAGFGETDPEAAKELIIETDIPCIVNRGRKGGSNLAATLCNAILTFDDAEQLKPGKDL